MQQVIPHAPYFPRIVVDLRPEYQGFMVHDTVPISAQVADRGLSSTISYEPNSIRDLWNTSATATTRLPGFQRDIVESLFNLRERSRVLGFIESHPFLATLLVDAYDRLDAYFPTTERALWILEEPEEDDLHSSAELRLSVICPYDPEDALARLAAFDEDWWLTNLDRARGSLCIDLEYV